MTNKRREIFENLGQHVRGGPLPPPFDPPTTARDIALAMHAVLTEVGLSANAIRKVGCVLLSISRNNARPAARSLSRKPKEMSDDDG